ncbi:HypC/HybG/HupF family hydrogenase formation chaperone [Thiomonas sp. FB-Cd]|uniref:HypC/HybG/HupF family hydrogenase formation chaperone n=1 Tax=Thiomonas sp. FB-Cd TaxID=1158292 RepID=UPI0004DEEF8B|nr:HypC/HybG/HupF family hydrogenase formation chaperone [Thiomonas sp. FB-Cd]
MCLGIPMQIVESANLVALCEGRGVRRTVNLALVGEQPTGVWLLVLQDAAREVLDAEEARRIDLALDGVEAALRGETDLAAYFPDLGNAPAPPQ